MTRPNRARRARGDGAIFQLADGRWCARLELAPEDGKRRRRTFIGETREAVRQRLLAAQRDGVAARGRTRTVGGLLAAYLDDRRDRAAPRTIEGFEEIVRLHLTPFIGDVPVVDVDARAIETFLATLARLGRTAATQRRVRVVLSAAFSYGVRVGLAVANPVAAVRAPRVARRDMRTWTEEEAQRFLAATRDDFFAELYVVALATGLRQGELFALRREDVDLERGELHLQRSASRPRGHGVVFTEGKTRTARRHLQLPNVARAAIVRALEKRLALGIRSPWIFATTAGTVPHPTNVRRRSFAPAIARAKVPSIRFHDLRHTFATISLGRGVPIKVVSEMLGHASVAITMDLYQHVLPHMQRAAADAIDAALVPKRRTARKS